MVESVPLSQGPLPNCKTFNLEIPQRQHLFPETAQRDWHLKDEVLHCRLHHHCRGSPTRKSGHRFPPSPLSAPICRQSDNTNTSPLCCSSQSPSPMQDQSPALLESKPLANLTIVLKKKKLMPVPCRLPGGTFVFSLPLFAYDYARM